MAFSSVAAKNRPCSNCHRQGRFNISKIDIYGASVFPCPEGQVIHGGGDHMALEDILTVAGIVVGRVLRPLVRKAEPVERCCVLVVR
jgi:hypothetical protein